MKSRVILPLRKIAWSLPDAVLVLLLATGVAARTGTDDREITPAIEKTQPSFWDQQYLLGDWGGERTALEKEGVSFDFNNIGDFLTDGASVWLPPVLGPLVGGVLGALAYDFFIGRSLVQAHMLSQDPEQRSEGMDSSHTER